MTAHGDEALSVYKTPAGFAVPPEATRSSGGEDPLRDAPFIKRFLHHFRTERAPFRWLLSRVLYRSRLGSLIKFSRGSYRMHFFATSMTLSAWDDSRAWRDDEVFLRRVLREGDLVVDVGANVGFVTLPAASLVGKSGRVVAVEPHPQTFAYLRRNVKLNQFGQVTLYKVAVGQTEGKVHFSSFALHDNNNRVVNRGLAVRLTTLDRLLQDEPREIRLLKVDVEGFEKFVFEGAVETLARTQLIYFEIAEYNFVSNGYTTRDLLEFIVNSGFDLFVVDSSGKESPVGTAFVTDGWTNLLARRKR